MPIIVFSQTDCNLPDPTVVRADAPPYGSLLNYQGTYQPDLPAPTNVLAGVSYGVDDQGGPFTGTLVVPSIPQPLTGVMNFRVVNQAIIDTLGLSANGLFRVVGYRGQGKAAEEVKNNLRSVQSYFSNGEFPKSAGRQTGPTQHNMTFGIGLTVSAPARVNLSAINAPGATSGQIAAAMSAMTEAAYNADILLDELYELVYQILMDGRNFDLNLPVGTMSNRWVGSLQKDDPNPRGDLVVLTGTLTYTCNTVESPAGATGTIANSVTTVLDIIGDDIERTGVTAN